MGREMEDLQTPPPEEASGDNVDDTTHASTSPAVDNTTHPAAELSKTPNLSVDEPLQLIEFVRCPDNDQTTIKLVDATLSTISQRAGPRPLSIICICGPSRQGKSFLLGYLIRYLTALESDETDWFGWDDKKKPLDGFKFRNGSKPETQGIWVWSRPFIVKTEEGKEVAVLLIDTQGTHDEFTTAKDMSAIVGLSLLTSSIMIFNCFSNVQEDVLTSLNTYTHYGQLALDTESEKQKKAFQKLIFLVRDWNNPGEFPYGAKGGKKFLQEKLRIKEDQPEEAKKVRKVIGDCFDNLDCFLMPYIGEKGLYPDFTGSVGELELKFAKNLEQFIVSLITNEEMVVKEVYNELVSAQDLRGILERYLEIFNSEEMPSAKTMLEATHEYHNGIMLKKAVAKFLDVAKKKMRGKSYLPEDEMEKALKNAEKIAKDLFNKARKFGSKDKIEEWKDQLDETLKTEKKNLVKSNEESRRKYIESAREEALQKCRELLETELCFDDGEFYEDVSIKRAISLATEEVVKEFKEKLEKEEDEELKSKVATLVVILEQTTSNFENRNKANRAEAEKALLKSVNSFVERFQTEAEKVLDEQKFSGVNRLEPQLQEIINSVNGDFKAEKKPGKKEFHVEFQQKLASEMEKVRDILLTNRKLKLQELQTELDKYILDECEAYQEDLKEAVASAELEEEVDKIHADKSSKVIEKFVEGRNPYPIGEPLHEAAVEKLKKDLAQVCDNIKRDVVLNRQRVEESYRNAKEHAMNVYLEAMKEIIESCDFLSDDDLHQEHNAALKEAMQEYESIEKQGVPENALNLKHELEEKLKEKYETLKGQNKISRDLANSKADNLVHRCHSRYQEIMKGEMDKVRDEDELETVHKAAREQVMEELSRDIPAKEDSEFVDKHKEKLEGDIEDTWEELKDIFEMERNKDETDLKGLLVECRKYYNDEMKTHIQNTSFMRPDILEEFHQQAKKVALDRCKATQPLRGFQEARLEEELEGIYEKVEEKNDMKLNSVVSPAIGIDLGTTYCCVAVFINGKVVYIPNTEQGNAETTPSYVGFKPDGSKIIGDAAKQSAYENPENTIYDAKRVIGRKMNDPKLQEDMKYWPFEVVEDDGVPKIMANGKPYFPEQISAELLSNFRLMAEKFLSVEVTKAVITVPAYFNDGQRQATVDAGELAGLEVLTILNEPTAAAIAYSMERLDNTARKVLIFDLGGGTFDVAVLDVTNKEIKVLGVDGDTHLGGEDFDKHMMEHCALKFKAEEGVDILAHKDSTDKRARYDSRRRMRRLQTECEKAKKALSSGRTTTVALDAMYEGLDLKVEMSRDEFEKMNVSLFEKSIKIVEKALLDAKVRKEEVEDIVLVGGSTRIPKVQEMLKSYFGGRALNYSIHPDKAVAYGAAIKAAMMNGEQAKGQIDFNSIEDVTPLPIGVEVHTKELSVIIPKNSKIPKRCKEQYWTVHDNQKNCSIKVYQGEDYWAANNELLGEFVLDGIPPGPAGKEIVDVFMEMDSMGILHVEAVSRSTKSRNTIKVTANKQRMSADTKRKLLDEASDPAA